MEDRELEMMLANNAPQEDFCNLSANNMYELLYNTLGVESPLKIKNNLDDAILDNVPFLRLTEALIKIIIRDGFIKLTPLGALPRKVLHELYDHHFFKEELFELGIYKLNREADSIILSSLHINTVLAGLIKKTNGRLLITKAGKQFSDPANRNALFKIVLQTFTTKFNWGFHDLYPEDTIVQNGWGFSMYLLSLFGDKQQDVIFYSNKFLQAFSAIREQLDDFPERTAEEQFKHWYWVRTINRFAEWFGFVEVENTSKYPLPEIILVKKSAILSSVFEFE